MKSEEDKIIRPDHEDASVHVTDATDGFVPSYKPESLTKITVPDLPDDATGMSAEALAKVPTLTEQVATPAPTSALVPEPPAQEPTPEHVEVATDGAVASVDVAPREVPELQAETGDAQAIEPAAQEAAAQDTPPAAESWVEQCQVRIDQLSDEIQKLNDRLDQLEQTTKV